MSAPLTYSYHPRLGGAGVRLTLEDGTLSWLVGPREGRMRLVDIVRLSLRFLPAKFAHSTFELEIVSRQGKRLVVASTSRTSLTAVSDQGPEFANFVVTLHQALAAAGVKVECRGGYRPLRWWIMAVVGMLTGIGLAVVTGFVLVQGQWLAAGLVALLSVGVGWPTAEALARNRPIRYALDALPPRLLPR